MLSHLSFNQNLNYYWVKNKKHFFVVDSSEILIDAEVSKKNINLLRNNINVKSFRIKNHKEHENNVQLYVKRKDLSNIKKQKSILINRTYPAIHEQSTNGTSFITDEISFSFDVEPDFD